MKQPFCNRCFHFIETIIFIGSANLWPRTKREQRQNMAWQLRGSIQTAPYNKAPRPLLAAEARCEYLRTSKMELSREKEREHPS
jgi:hypothetical protein